METKKDTPDYELRQRAEKKLRETTGGREDISGISPERMAALIHELEVHQIELTMQNDELRRIQGELERTSDRYSHLYDFSPVGYLTLSEKGIIEEANITISSMLGIERSALIGKPFTRFILREDQDILYKHRQRLLETETPLSCELRLIRKDEHGLHVRLECMLIKNKGDDLRQIRAAVSDITENKRM
ncbi:PAS domain-containing protein, partial [Thermodesulfobacteriota bacterium]